MSFLTHAGLERLWAHIISKLNELREWANKTFLGCEPQSLTPIQQEQVKANIGIVEETPDDALDMLVEAGVINAVIDKEGFVLTDENNNILTI